MIDENVLEQFEELQIEGKKDIIVEIIDSFLEQSKLRMENIELNIKKMNINDISIDAHIIKSGARTLGANSLGDLCQEIENLRGSNNFDIIKNLCIKLKIEYPQTCEKLLNIRIKRENK
ncbi:MAG: Hpt domain-containing protein [Silvanigrellaceae bacterium]|nr:Hpt domain-containing protein [Silvanigrellaceae bacterium]